MLDISLDDDFLGSDFISKSNKNKRNYIKLKGFWAAKETFNTMKRQPTEWEKIFANQIFNKMLIPKIFKEPIYCIRKKKS